ncbi:MAG: toprim domain-containing protein, partial [Mollicutes bacterium]|nr:toprim domain-containing protein [Mollicutes bacterium]
MKLNLNNSLIVVEGTTDKNYLSSFIDSSFYIVNGSAITSKDLEFIKLASKNKQIIILTDPDFPGMQIRNKINNYVKGCYNAFVKKELSIKNHKVGVAE